MNSEHNKRLFNPYTEAIFETIKKRKLNEGVQNILPSPGLIGPPVRERLPWPNQPVEMDEIEKLTAIAQQAEKQRQMRINKATYETTNIGPIREIVNKPQ